MFGRFFPSCAPRRCIDHCFRHGHRHCLRHHRVRHHCHHHCPGLQKITRAWPRDRRAMPHTSPSRSWRANIEKRRLPAPTQIVQRQRSGTDLLRLKWRTQQRMPWSVDDNTPLDDHVVDSRTPHSTFHRHACGLQRHVRVGPKPIFKRTQHSMDRANARSLFPFFAPELLCRYATASAREA